MIEYLKHMKNKEERIKRVGFGFCELYNLKKRRKENEQIRL